MKNPKFIRKVILFSLFNLGIVSVQAQQKFNLSPIPTLGGASNDAVAINNVGQIVGASKTTSGAIHAYFYML